MSADLLLGRFQKLPDGTHIVGGKDIRSFGIDAETGKVRFASNRLDKSFDNTHLFSLPIFTFKYIILSCFAFNAICCINFGLSLLICIIGMPRGGVLDC